MLTTLGKPEKWSLILTGTAFALVLMMVMIGSCPRKFLKINRVKTKLHNRIFDVSIYQYYTARITRLKFHMVIITPIEIIHVFFYCNI